MAEPLVQAALAPAREQPSRRYVLAAAGLALTAGLTWLAIRSVDPHAFFVSFRESVLWYLVPAGAALVAQRALKRIATSTRTALTPSRHVIFFPSAYVRP